MSAIDTEDLGGRYTQIWCCKQCFRTKQVEVPQSRLDQLPPLWGQGLHGVLCPKCYRTHRDCETWRREAEDRRKRRLAMIRGER